MDRETLMVVFVGIIAGCVLCITLGLLGVVIALLRAKQKVSKEIQIAQSKAMPFVNAVKEKAEPGIEAVSSALKDLQPKIKAISDDLQPKIKSISEDISEISQVIRAQVTDLDSTISEATSKARSQVERVNSFVTTTMDTTAEVAQSLERGIKVPVRGVQGIVNGIKAGFEVLSGHRRGPVRSQTRQAERHVAEQMREVHAAADQARARAAEGYGAGVRSVEQAGTPGPLRSGGEGAPELRRTLAEAKNDLSVSAAEGAEQAKRTMVEAGEEVVAEVRGKGPVRS